MHEFFSFNFPLRECFFCTSPARPISFLMVRPLPLLRLGNAGDKDRRSNLQRVKTLLLHSCALRKFHVTDGQTTRDQITSERS